ncbi:O-antigen export system permease protein [Candidatus Photodesmus blepharus]|uniref:Transport permease protein n=1 Tax=Candidatus Photodesmus blepharonis TaxID=1179155 RepID=A0A084CMG8_9GAMM|nr:O-antigen export system permease protein [Candidatus Photodesmus blepharus]
MINAINNKAILVFSLAFRDIRSRYKGSVLGWLWTLITPMVMLVVYTFIFEFVFKSRWSESSLSGYDFSINLFIGMIIFSFFSECFTRAPSYIHANTNYVKKIVFNLEIIPISYFVSAFFHLLTGLLIWFVMIQIVSDLTVTLYKFFSLILVLVSFSIMTLGVGYYLSAFGAFIRDTNQICTSLTTLLLFISPVFYDSSALPVRVSNIILLNPISYPILEIRSVLLNGRSLDFDAFLVYNLFGITIFLTGVVFFRHMKKGFIDVV